MACLRAFAAARFASNARGCRQIAFVSTAPLPARRYAFTRPSLPPKTFPRLPFHTFTPARRRGLRVHVPLCSVWKQSDPASEPPSPVSSDDDLRGAVGRLPAFEGAGVDVARTFVRDDQIVDKIDWDREEKYDALAKELIDLHVELQDALGANEKPSETLNESRGVEHLGHGVYAQYNKLPLDNDSEETSPATITRVESRSIVHHALDALQSRKRVAVTGQPGIGKTRGSMMYALQTLLHRKAAVLYVGYKSEEMLLVLPGEDGRYRAWTQSTDCVRQTLLKKDARVVMVIDPPEDEPYSSAGRCRVLKFVSNNAEKHFRNWDKDGVLLVTSMSSEEEVVAMTNLLWNGGTTPHSWQRRELGSLDEKVAEVRKRVALVGPIPRLVFNSVLFTRAVKTYASGSVKAAGDVSDSELYAAMLGKYSPFLEKHDMSVSSRLFWLQPVEVKHMEWKGREMHDASLQLNPIARLKLRERLEKQIAVLRTESFEDFAFDWTCETQKRRAEVQYREEVMQDQAFRRIASLRSSEGVVYRPAAGNFPGIDFAIDALEWYNARSMLITLGNKIEIGEGGIRTFLSKLEEVMRMNMSGSEIEDLLASGSPVLTMLTNRELEPRLKESAESYKLFDKEVELKAINLQDLSAMSEMLHTSRTEQLLEELQELSD